MVNIYNYNNYREYLKDFYSFNKKEKTGLTYARFSTKAGLGSPNYYKLVADGEKNLTSSNIIKFAKALELEHCETEYFEALVYFNQSKKNIEKEFYQKRLERSKKLAGEDHNSQRRLEEFEFELVSNWTFHAVMLLTNLPDFRESPRWISKKLYGLVSAEEASKIIEKLLLMNMIKYDNDGKLIQTHKRFKTKAELKRKSAQHFYQGLLDRAAISLQLNDSDERELGAYLVGISRGQVPIIKERVRSFLSELNELALENSNPEQIYSLMFTGFPLSSEEDFPGEELWQ